MHFSGEIIYGGAKILIKVNFSEFKNHFLRKMCGQLDN